MSQQEIILGKPKRFMSNEEVGLPSPTPEQLAYIAGLVDGEGTIGILRDTTSHTMVKKHHYRAPYSYKAYVSIANNSRMLLKWAQDCIGRGRLGSKRNGAHWRLNWECQQAKRVCELLLPYLILKKPQAELLIEFQSIKRRGSYGRWHPEYIVSQMAYHERMKPLNKRGNRLPPSSHIEVIAL